MTTRERTSPQIQPYLDVLETRIGGLSSDERTELLNDLEDHLEEILADDSQEPLSQRIGSPDSYAEEFVGSIGIAARAVGERSLLDTISESALRVTRLIGTSRAGDIWEEMRPAWWTIRGLAIGLFLVWNYLGPGDPQAAWVMQIVAGVTLVGFIWASMRIGRNRVRTDAWKWLSIAVTVFGVFTMFALSANISARLNPYTYESGPYPVHLEEGSYRYGSLTEEDFQLMSQTGMTPEEYFASPFYQDNHEDGFPPSTTVNPSDPPLIILP